MQRVRILISQNSAAQHFPRFLLLQWNKYVSIPKYDLVSLLAGKQLVYTSCFLSLKLRTGTCQKHRSSLAIFGPGNLKIFFIYKMYGIK